MRGGNNMEGMLSPYRVLDLTDEKGLLCGKLLGDLGADVIKIERPGGDPARQIGPFYHDEPDPEKSLFWWAFNTSKRGITLDFETTAGRDSFKKLVQRADFVVESFPPGYLDRLGLGYSTLEQLNPGVIMISISPFGQTGPYKDYKAPDIVAWAMSGQMYAWGDIDRPPIHISHHSQAHLHAAGEAAVAAMIALRHRELTGEGQHIDVSIQGASIQVSFLVTAMWEMMRINLQRGGVSATVPIQVTRMWPCKDGYVIWYFFAGTSVYHLNAPLIKWMDDEGMATDFLRDFVWETFDFMATTQEIVDQLEEPTRKFFLSRTKAELMAGALQRGIILYPVSTTKDILESEQIAARKFWVELEHPELGTTITYPGSFAYSSEAPPRVSRRAPLIGEHNQEILEKELPVISQIKSSRPKPDIKSNQQRKKPLEGLKVVDFSWNIAIPLVTKCFADHGAEVIKIESVSRPDQHRLAGPFKDAIVDMNRAGSFAQYHTSEFNIALNLANPKGVELAKKFVARADIVVENFAGGVIERIGLGYEELKKVKPDIIMLASCMLGHSGPHYTHPGFGTHLTALSGFNHIAGWPDREPGWLAFYTDYIAPHFNGLAILAALDYRRRTGKGQYIDMSQYENGAHFLAPLILDYAVNKRVDNRLGNRSESATPHGAYRCLGEDRWCVIAVSTDEEWQAFCRVLANPAWINEPRFASFSARKDNEDELDRLVEEWTMNRTAEDVMNLMQASGVPAGVVEHGEDLLEYDPQLKHRHFFWELDHPEIGVYRAWGPAFIMSKSSCELRRAALLGEHNEYALKEILGMSDDDIAELVIEGAIE